MMFVNTHNKYTPQSLDEFVFSNEEVKELATAYASGHLERPLILHGVSGGGNRKILTNCCSLTFMTNVIQEL